VDSDSDPVDSDSDSSPVVLDSDSDPKDSDSDSASDVVDSTTSLKMVMISCLISKPQRLKLERC